MPNLTEYLKDWFHLGWAPAAGRLIWACIATTTGFAILASVIRRPRRDRQPTWAEAAVGTIFVFAMFLLCYAAVPSEWINFSDKYLKWTTDQFVWKHTQTIPGLGIKFPFDMNKQNVRDAIAVGIYAFFFLTNIVLWLKWQRRPTASESEAVESSEPKVVGTSRFGRPLKAKA